MSETAAVTCRPIGVIRTEHVLPDQTPIQPAHAGGGKGRVEVFPEFAEGLRDLEGFSHIYLIYHFHRSEPARLIVRPFLQDVERGVFAIRATWRPNPIGLSSVELESRQGAVLHIINVDILDGTPLLDIKPHTGKFDRFESTRNGWQDSVDEETARRRGRRGYTGVRTRSPNGDDA
jgi:tRNA-Thr(GGU) m(6)t(6)A37 methyltransferase TsaA